MGLDTEEDILKDVRISLNYGIYALKLIICVCTFVLACGRALVLVLAYSFLKQDFLLCLVFCSIERKC